MILPLKDIAAVREVNTKDYFDLLQIWLPTRYQMRITEFRNIVVISTKNCCTGWGIAVRVIDSVGLRRWLPGLPVTLSTADCL